MASSILQLLPFIIQLDFELKCKYALVTLELNNADYFNFYEGVND